MAILSPPTPHPHLLPSPPPSVALSTSVSLSLFLPLSVSLTHEMLEKTSFNCNVIVNVKQVVLDFLELLSCMILFFLEFFA